jgi:hypothetical protein
MFMVPVWSPFSHQGGYPASLPLPLGDGEQKGGIIVSQQSLWKAHESIVHHILFKKHKPLTGKKKKMTPDLSTPLQECSDRETVNQQIWRSST